MFPKYIIYSSVYLPLRSKEWLILPCRRTFSSKRPCCPGCSVYSAVPLENLMQAEEMNCVKVRLLSLLATLFRNLDSEEVYSIFWTREHRKKKTVTGGYDMDLVLFCLHISRKTTVQTCLRKMSRRESVQRKKRMFLTWCLKVAFILGLADVSFAA